MDREINWIQDNLEAIQLSPSWEAFCASQGPLGAHYMKYSWLQKHYDFAKERGLVMCRTIAFPQARCYPDLFSEAVIVKQEIIKGHGSRYNAPPGFVYIAEPTIAGHYGGRRTLDMSRAYGDGSPIRCHYGASWHVCYVKPRVSIQRFPSGRNFALQPGSLEAIKREDGVLIVVRSRNGIGDEWLALLDEGDSLESLLSAPDEDFLLAERKAEKEAYAL